MKGLRRAVLLVLVGSTCTAVVCSGKEADCNSFCTAAVAACPEEETQAACESSCLDYAGDDIGQSNVECAQNASSCDEIHICWTELLDPAGGDTGN
jgi:hypothetical protein